MYSKGHTIIKKDREDLTKISFLKDQKSTFIGIVESKTDVKESKVHKTCPGIKDGKRTYDTTQNIMFDE